MTLDKKSGNNGVDAISMVANQLHVDLSATIKPDANKGVGQVAAAAEETSEKLAAVHQIETSLHQELAGRGEISGPAAGSGKNGGLTHGQAMLGLSMLGLVAPAVAAGAAVLEAARFVATPVQVPGIHAHAATVQGPSLFRSASSTSSSSKEKAKDYEDALGGWWDANGFKTAAPDQKNLQQTQQPRMPLMKPDELRQASQTTIDTLGAKEVLKDLGQVTETKKRLGQQGQEALDQAARIGMAPEQQLVIKPFLSKGPSFFG